MNYDTAHRLAAEIKASGEYSDYALARERANENATTRALIEEYNRLQIRAQAASIMGERSDEALQKLQKVGELLQFDQDGANYLLCEYRLKAMLADLYKILADAAGVDLGSLEA